MTASHPPCDDTPASAGRATTYPRLFEGVRLGTHLLSNRLVCLAHGTGMVRDGKVMPEDIAYWNQLAGSGVSLLIHGGMTVHPAATLRHRNRVEAYAEDSVEGLRQRCASAQARGVKVIGQLTHIGRESTGGDSDFPAVAPSPIRSPRDPFPPHELEVAEIAEIVAGFRTTAANLRRACYDGAEIHGAHGYLVAQFLSPATNQRHDSYGGDAERRMRFLKEIVTAIREECGREFLLSLRLSADEEVPGGLGVADTIRIAESMARDRSIDLLNITGGVRGAYVKDFSAPRGVNIVAAKRIRETSGLPVVVGQRVTRPELAEQILREGAADLIGMARALIADPEWVRKTRSGEAALIRPCIALNQDCRAFAPFLRCAVNPVAGRETEHDYRSSRRALLRKRVAVVGAGPAGMEAARVAAMRGHTVSIYEASSVAGGQFAQAAAVAHHEELRAFLDFQILSLRRSGVRMELGAAIANADDVGRSTDVVVLATGAVGAPLDGKLSDRGVVSCWEVSSNGVPLPKGRSRAVLVDDGSGFWPTYCVAEALVAAGWQLLLVSAGAAVPANIPAESVGALLRRLGAGNPRFRTLSRLREVATGQVEVENVVSGDIETFPADLIVVQTGRIPAASPAPAFQARGIKTHSIGDCVAPRRLSDAVREGYRIGAAL
jgi:2,4-dienoyl-CoA reductase-like NADH-dependent reductase (Old Yellow Enzyme family)/thioredoxin reductase